MGATKKDQFTKEQNHVASLAKAMAHPARIAILEYLFKLESCVCGEIVNEIGLAQSTVSQHLKALKEAGLIQGDIDGSKVCYCLNKKNFNKLSDILFRFSQSGNIKNCC